MRLHVTYAGGTIGMVDSPEGLRPGADLQGWFGSQLEGIELASNITMSTLDPLIDSSERPGTVAHTCNPSTLGG